MKYFTMFAPYCVFTSPLARAPSVHSVAQPHPERHDQATQCIVGLHLKGGSFCLLRASYSALSTHRAMVIERHKQTSTLVVKLLRALWQQLSTFVLFLFIPFPFLFFVRPEHVMMMPFFIPGLFYLQH